MYEDVIRQSPERNNGLVDFEDAMPNDQDNADGVNGGLGGRYEGGNFYVEPVRDGPFVDNEHRFHQLDVDAAAAWIPIDMGDNNLNDGIGPSRTTVLMVYTTAVSSGSTHTVQPAPAYMPDPVERVIWNRPPTPDRIIERPPTPEWARLSDWQPINAPAQPDWLNPAPMVSNIIAVRDLMPDPIQ